MADYIHALRTGLIKGADFMGASLDPSYFSPGHMARKFGIISHDYSNYSFDSPGPKTDERLTNRNSLENKIHKFGIAVGVGSNVFFLLPQLSAYGDRIRNKFKQIPSIREELSKKDFYKNRVNLYVPRILNLQQECYGKP